MKIEVTKSEILKEVEKQSSLAASMLVGDNAPRYEDIRVTEYDGDLIDSFWKDGANAVVQLFIRYISNETVAYNLSTYDGTEILTIKADMPDSFNDLLTGSIATGVKMMLACNIMASWMSVKYPGAAQKYKDDSLGYANDIKQKLLFRASPAQNRIRDFKTDTVIEQSEDFFKTKDADVVTEQQPDYFAVKTKETIADKDADYFSSKAPDTAVEQSEEYFKEKVADTLVESSNDYFAKGEADSKIDKDADYFSSKAPDTAVEQSEEYFKEKGSDNIILKQYENCNINPEQGRDNERHCKCGSHCW